MPPTDAELLRDYAARASDHAFAAIVTRHTDLVYSAALRQTGVPETARDITQGVFTDLARKAGALAQQLDEHASLAGWLYHATRFAVLTARREERRRQAREKMVMEQFDPAPAPDDAWAALAPVLDEAMAELGDTDREAVVLRYFQNQDFSAVAVALGVSEAAAQKRVSRAVERLRDLIAKRGVTTGASGLVVLISANAVVAAPVEICGVISTSVLSNSASMSTAFAAAAHTTALTVLQKSLIGGALLLAAAATVTTVNRFDSAGSSKTLTDGSKVTIRQVSFGKEHVFVPGSLWQRAVAGVSTNLAAQFGIAVLRDSSTQANLIVRMEWHDRTNRAPFPQWLRVLDSNGLASYDENVFRTINGSNFSMLASFRLQNFPRRERELRLELTAPHPTLPNTRQHIANFRVPNPAYAAAPPARVPARPQTVEMDGEAFTLLGLRTGLSATGSLAQMYPSNHWTELVFRIGTNEPARLTTNLTPTGPWSISYVELRDDWGNVVQKRDPFGRIMALGQQWMSRRDEGVALIPGSIWPDQTWHVRAEFQRNLDFIDEAQRWTASFSLPGLGEKTSLAETAQVNGCTVELRSVEYSAPYVATLIVRLTAPDLSYGLRSLRVLDQRGSNIVSRQRSIANVGGRNRPTPVRDFRFELRPVPESRQLRANFVVTHAAVVEVSAPATILRTNVAHWVLP